MPPGGPRRAPSWFLVLKASAMPSILVELGFISTPEEERYLNTDAGTTTLANGIFRAFLTYKREQEIRLNGSSQTILPEDLPEEKDTTPAGTTPNATEKTVRQDSNSTPRRTEKTLLRKQKTTPRCSRYKYSHLPAHWQK